MNRLRQALIVLLVVLLLTGFLACGEDAVKVRPAGREKAKKEGKGAAEKAKKKAEKAKEDVDGEYPRGACRPRRCRTTNTSPTP